MYELTVKWPSGHEFTDTPYTEDEAEAMAAFLRACGADDVTVRLISEEQQ